MATETEDRTRPLNGPNGRHAPGESMPPTVAGGTRLAALAGLTVVMVALCAALAVPVLPALTWGTALAILAWPLHAYVARRIGRPNLAAGLSTAAVVLLILVPVLFTVVQVARESARAAELIRGETDAGTPSDWLAQAPGFGRAVRWAETMGIDLDARAHKLARAATQYGTDLAASSPQAVVQCLVAVVVLFFLLRDKEAFVAGLRGLLPMTDDEGRHVAKRAADSVHANLIANVVTSTIDGVCAGLLFWALGIPAPFAWAAVTFVIALMPGLGSAAVWVPATILLALVGWWGAAAAVLAWGLTTWVVVDNLLYVRLLGGRLRLHPLPLLVSMLGGLVTFGVSGLVLGPAILAVTEALLDVWKRRRAGAATAASEAGRQSL